MARGAGCLNWARPDPWGAGAGNCPGLPDMLKKSGLLALHRGGETFADLGGLEALKSFCSRALRPGRPAGARARGVLLLGPPGSGKSAFCKALGAETGRPTLILDVGALLGSLVGQ